MSEKRDAQREVTRIALSGIAGFGFALAGSGAIREHGVIDRPTQDVDMFTTTRKVIRQAHDGVLLGPLMCSWTTVVRPSFSGAECASRRPGRGGAGRRGPRDRRVTAEHVT